MGAVDLDHRRWTDLWTDDVPAAYAALTEAGEPAVAALREWAGSAAAGPRNPGTGRGVVQIMPNRFSDAERQKFLADNHVGVLSVAANDGRPPASVPIWYDYEPGGNIRINTTASQRKARLIREAGTATLVVHRAKPPYQYVIVEGTVVDAVSPAPTEIREAIAARYIGEEAARAFVRGIDGADQVLFIIRPDRWFSADYSDEHLIAANPPAGT